MSADLHDKHDEFSNSVLVWITFGCSINSSVEFTYPVSLMQFLTFSNFPLQAFLTCEIILMAQSLAA